MSSKIIFFDIDGTLWDSENVVPASAALAIERLKKAGHKVYINSGRTRSFIQDRGLLGLGFDGIVSGCGTMVESGGETLYYHEIDRELSLYTMEHFKKHNVYAILEGKDNLYMDFDYFGKYEYGKRLMEVMGDALLPLEEYWGRWSISKMSIALMDATSDNENIYEGLRPYYTIMQHSEDVSELVPTGHDKGTGVYKVCELTGILPEDTYAFGDSANDKEMMEAVGHSIAMGNGTQELKDMCEHVTESLREDGILRACEYYGLV